MSRSLTRRCSRRPRSRPAPRARLAAHPAAAMSGTGDTMQKRRQLADDLLRALARGALILFPAPTAASTPAPAVNPSHAHSSFRATSHPQRACGPSGGAAVARRAPHARTARRRRDARVPRAPHCASATLPTQAPPHARSSTAARAQRE
jgi:hypothetical protein